MKNRIAIWLAIVSVCAMQLTGAGKAPVPTDLALALAGAAPLQANGDFVISVKRQGRWQEVGRLGADRFLREQRLDLAPWLPGAQKSRLRIVQAGGGASYLDAVLLGGRAAHEANAGILDKVSRRDNDLAPSCGRKIDLTFAAGADRVLSLTGRIESPVIGTEPLQFPRENTFRVPSNSSSFYSYRLGSAAPPQRRLGSPAWLAEVGRRRPLFEVLSSTGSGHPSGYTYGWVSNDARNLYVTIDFTPDNTYDGDKDYAKVYVRGSGPLREFKVSEPERTWGRPHFVTTDKAAYQHKVYDFSIPLSELPGAASGELDLCFAAYGTAAAGMQSLNLAYDRALNRYLMVYTVFTGSSSDVFGRFISIEGRDIGSSFVIAGAPGRSEERPIVAYDSVNRRYMVVWHEYSGTSFLRGQLLAADGSPVGTPFEILSTTFYLNAKAIAYDNVNQRYLVVWDEVNKGHSAIMGQLRDRDGGVVYYGSAPYLDITNYGFDGSFPDVAFDSQSEQFLVVWENAMGGVTGPADIGYDRPLFGRMVASSGAFSGDVFALASSGQYHTSPTVANDSVNHRFLVAWIQVPESSSAVSQALRQRDAGAPSAVITGNYTIAGQLVSNMGEPIGGANDISTAPTGHFNPQLAFDPVHERFLAIFQAFNSIKLLVDRRRESASGIPFDSTVMGQFLNSRGYPVETDPAMNFKIGSDSFFFFSPALANESVCGRFLAAWSVIMDPNVARRVIGYPCVKLPTVTTAPLSEVSATGATGGGEVTSDGGAPVTERGVCWNTSGSPTVFNARTIDGGGIGSFTSALSGLLPGVAYRVRAYATNSAGTAYGEEVAFTTPQWLVTFVADAGGTLSGQTPQYVSSGDSCTPVGALPGPGYFFRKWEGDSGFHSLDNPLTVTNVTSDLTFYARFGSLGISARRYVEHAWIIKAEFVDIEIEVNGLADSGAAKILLQRRTNGGAWELLDEILPGDFTAGRYTLARQPLETAKGYSFRVEARSASGALLGVSAEVTI